MFIQISKNLKCRKYNAINGYTWIYKHLCVHKHVLCKCIDIMDTYL